MASPRIRCTTCWMPFRARSRQSKLPTRPSRARCSLKSRCQMPGNEERSAAETTPVPLLTLFSLMALLDLQALNSNNVRGGTCLAEAGVAKKSG